MGAVAKNTMSQLMPAARQPVPELFMEDSVRPMRIMGLKEAQRLSRFVAVLVLVPAGSADNRGFATQSRGKALPGESSETSKLLEVFRKARTPVKAQSAASTFVVGDVTVSFSSIEASREGELV